MMKSPFFRLATSLNAIILYTLVFLFIYYGYQNILPLPPEGIHSWRQSDCASMAWNYYSTTANFFTPHFHNLFWGGTGSSAGEFPLIYWVSGMLYRLLGPGEWIFRSLNILIVFAGLWGYGRTTHLLTGEKFWPVMAITAVFVSPAMVFYTNNFLPDAPAIGFSLLGWWFFFQFRESQIHRQFVWALVFFTLGMLIKLSAGISLLMAGAIWFFEWNKWGGFGEEKNIFPQPRWKYLLYFGGAVGIIAAWYIYADIYSKAHDVYFVNKATPLTDLDQGKFQYIIFQYFRYIGPNFYSTTMHLVLIFLTLLGFSSVGRKYKLLFALSALSLTGVVAYIYLFFVKFDIHDYYMIVASIFPAMIFLLGTKVMKEDFPALFVSVGFKILVAGFLFYNVYYAKMEMQRRYYGNQQHYRTKEAFYEPEFQTFLDSVGVTKDKTVVAIPHIEPNYVLYLMDRKGWVGNQHKDYTETMGFVNWRGADFLILSDTNLFSEPKLQPFMTDTVGSYKDVYVFRLKN
ncbi:MAG: glycosyltransferase family 39 protein [Bacteroidia bacterium]|nr:glycosyltransferase family 39 protein [Bacteroidia bacterium]